MEDRDAGTADKTVLDNQQAVPAGSDDRTVMAPAGQNVATPGTQPVGSDRTGAVGGGTPPPATRPATNPADDWDNQSPKAGEINAPPGAGLPPAKKMTPTAGPSASTSYMYSYSRKGTANTGSPSQSGAAPAPRSAAPSVSGAAPRPAAPITSPTPDSLGGDTHVGAMPLPGPGTRINQYELIRELGRGGMGTVFLARDIKLGRRVAIKFLQTSHPELTQRFIREARATARCQHENIVIIYEVGEWNGAPYMVLEFIQGQTLTKLMEAGKMPTARAVELMVPVVKALVVAHEQGIVHRDLKPDNILVTDQGTVKVLDFGIAKVLQAETTPSRAHSGQVRMPALPNVSGEDTAELTRHGAIMGTMSYMSPEQWGIGIEIDHRTDIWACGIMLYRMLTGRHPLDPLRGQQLVVTAMLDKPMPRLKDQAFGLPNGLADVIDRCLLKHKEQRFDSARAFQRALEAFLPGRFTRELHIDESPYAGLTAFQETDADRFFGRSTEIASAVVRIRDRPLMAVVGTSGVGKSSFVRAGLVPALKQSGEEWEALVIRPGRNPLAALAATLAPLLSTSTSVADEVSRQEALMERLRVEPGYAGTVLRSQARRGDKSILLFIDQFEELYTLVPDPAERLAFTACLSGVADDATAPLRVVVSVRSDFLDRVPEDQRFMTELSQGLFFLLPPNRDGLRDALVQPAEMAGFHFESADIVENMLDHLEQTPGALPLLQFTASKLWEQRDSNRKLLTTASYHAIGGIVGALAAHADSVIHELSPHAQTLVRAIFLRLITPERTRAIVSVGELLEISRESGEIQRLVDHLVAARLLTVQQSADDDGYGSSVEIVHESLIHSWPTLRRWLDENQDDAGFLEQLRNAAKQWQGKGYDSDLLWRGEVVGEAEKFTKRYRGELPQVQRAFLKAVFDQEAKGIRRKRFALVAAVTFLTLLAVAASIALIIIRKSRNDAREQAVAAEAAKKVAEKAQADAESNLKKLVDKEEERKREEVAKKKALGQATEAKKGEAQALEDLRKKNTELQEALETAEESQKRAKKEKRRAEENEERALTAMKDAERARKEAESSKKRVERLLAKEKERNRRIIEQLGSDIVEKLK